MAQKYFTVLKSEYLPKFSFEIKLDGTHYEFSVAVRLGHIIFLYQIRQSSELVFIDSTSNLDENNLRFFLLVTHSVAGALPLGNFIAFHVFFKY